VAFLLDSAFSHFDTILACDRWTDGHTTMSNTVVAWCRTVKTSAYKLRHIGRNITLYGSLLATSYN